MSAKAIGEAVPLTPRKSALITGGIYAVGVALQFAAPLLRDRVQLSDDLFIGSFVYPWWVFLQLAALTATLAIMWRFGNGWTSSTRIGAGIVAAILWGLPYPDLVSTVIGPNMPLAQDPVRASLLWSVPLAFYLVPAALIVWAWLRRDARLSLVRALGVGLVFIGVVSFPFILWLTHLWRVYIQPTGGGTVLP